MHREWGYILGVADSFFRISINKILFMDVNTENQTRNFFEIIQFDRHPNVETILLVLKFTSTMIPYPF
jgi:hypothetical protein